MASEYVAMVENQLKDNPHFIRAFSENDRMIIVVIDSIKNIDQVHTCVPKIVSVCVMDQEQEKNFYNRKK